MRKHLPDRRRARRVRSKLRQPRYESLEPRYVFDSTVVFNEIMYHPATAPQAEGDQEWIELFNQMAINMDISGWRLEGAVSYTFAPGTVISGRSYLVVASNPTALAAAGVYTGAQGPFTDRLANAGEEIRLVNKDGRLMNTVEYADSGDWPVGPDGSGFSLAKIDPYTASDKPTNWTTSRQFNGTPGAANFPGGVTAGPAVVFNEIAAASASSFWLEIANRGTTNIDLTGYRIETSAGAGSAYVLPSQTLAPGQYLTITQAQLGFGAAAGDKLYFYTVGKDRLLDARAVSTRLQGLAPGYDNQWLYPSAPTPGAANSFNLHDEIVINEIMYHGMGEQPPTPISNTSKLVAIDGATQWRYNQTGASLGTSWAQTAHSGAGWQTGPALLAFESGSLAYPIRTTLDDPLVTGPGDPFVTTTYFETDFTFNGDLSSLSSLALAHYIDDGAVFYLNGVEVLRYNMPTGTVTSSTGASSAIEASYVGPVTIPKTALHAGLNRLSVEVHQVNSASTDIVFGAELIATTLTTPPGPTTFQESDEEWIELYNRSAAAVDISGWSIANAIDYTFAAGTIIPAGGYLVVAKHAAAMQALYPNIAIVGDFSKSLSNSDDAIMLLDANQNPADAVHYYDGGNWPDLADGGGSSLELRSPNSDNTKAEAWGASDQRDDGQWNTYTATLTAVAGSGPANVWNEFLFGMLGAGEVLIDDVSVISNPNSALATQLIQNGSFQSDTLGASPQKWRLIGNHHGTVVVDPDNATNKVLDLVATGKTNPEGNNAGTTFVGNTPIVNGTVYQISFKARWVGGDNQLNARGYLNRFQQTFIVTAPLHGGTPGAQNSNFVSNAGPTYSDFKHGPVVPSPAAPVTVSVKADDPNGVASMTLYWKLDGGSWSTVAMTSNASGYYTGVIPGQGAGKIVQFYVQGTDSFGAASTFPAAGANSRALYQVNDGQAPVSAIDSLRIIMLSAETSHLVDTTNIMSNQNVGATVIYNNSEVFYNVGVHLKGSSASRGSATWGGSYAVDFNPDHLFRGVQSEISVDSSGGDGTTGQSLVQILVDQILNHGGAGLPSNYDDLVYVVAPYAPHTGYDVLQLARYGNEFLDESYDNGSDGNLFEYEFMYYPKTTIDGNPESPKIQISGGGTRTFTFADYGSNKETYRWNYILKNNNEEDDYSAMIALNKAFALSGTTFLNSIGNTIDVEQWLRTFAVANLMGINDTFATDSNPHNIVFYARPDDGKVLMFPWDWDDAFRLSATGTGLVIGSSGDPLVKLMASPTYAHTYYGHMLDLLNTTVNSTYMTPYITSLGTLAQQSFTTYLNYINTRRSTVLSLLNSTVSPSTQFNITTNGGSDFSVNMPTTTLTGTGYLDVKEIRLAGSTQPLPITWISNIQWQVTVPLIHGDNPITLEAYDFQGNLVHTDSIGINSSFVQPTPRDSLRITEIMYHPSASPPGGTFDREEFEYIELQNIGNAPIDLTGVKLQNGVTFTFPAMTLAPGAYTLVVENAAAFASRYPGVANIAGAYSGKLDNSGELLSLIDANGITIQSFTYLDDDWYPETDGPGYSLVIVDPQADPTTWGQKSSWRVSYNLQGSPGVDDVPPPVPGDFDGDRDVDGADFIAWQVHYPTSSGATVTDGDADRDNDVDSADFGIWQTNFLANTPGASAVAAAGTETNEAAPPVPAQTNDEAPAGPVNTEAAAAPPAQPANSATAVDDGASTAVGEDETVPGDEAASPPVISVAPHGSTPPPPATISSPAAIIFPILPASRSSDIQPAAHGGSIDRTTEKSFSRLLPLTVDQIFAQDSMYRSRHFGRGNSKALPMKES